MKETKQLSNDDVSIVPTGCCHDCGGCCVLRAHVKDGRIIRFETDSGEEPQIRACLRGRAYRQRVYHPDRLKHPLQLLTAHPKTRAHSTWHNVPWLRELETHAVWINPDDAWDRQIRDGDRVDVFNDRGRIRLAANVTERIMPGVVSVNQGAWYEPDESGVDRGGCANVLTADAHSPGGAHHMNSALVQVEPAPGK